jgi:hypothetical protein
MMNARGLLRYPTMLWGFRLISAFALIGEVSIIASTLQPTATVPKLLIVPAFILMLLSLGGMMVTLIRREYIREGPSMFSYGGPGNEGSRWPWIPIPARIIAPVGIILLFILMSGFDMPTSEGGPALRDGRPVLESHGRVVREITEEEYRQANAAGVRMFACIGTAFVWLSVSVLWTLPTSPYRPLRGEN